MISQLKLTVSLSGGTSSKAYSRLLRMQHLAKVSSCYRTTFLVSSHSTLSQNLGGELLSIETYLILHPTRSTLFALALIAGVLYVLFRTGLPEADDLRALRTRFGQMPC